jgi:hypothetical protein
MQQTRAISRGPRLFLLAALLLAALTSSPTFVASAYANAPVPQAQTAQEPPVPAPAAVSEGRARYFTQTGHFLRGAFLQFWEANGATDVLGLPITEAIVQEGRAVQYLERVRLEWHPENPDPRNKVLLTRLGAINTESRGLKFDPLPAGQNTPSSWFFVETGHNLSNAFLTFWQRNGGLAVFGYPISEEIVERNEADGREYTVQYFERNRFEWHPELGPSDNVLIGLLGVEYARAQALSPLSRVLLPGPFSRSEEDLSQSAELDALVAEGLREPIRMLGRTPQFRWVAPLIVANNIRVDFEEVDEENVGGVFVASRTGNGTTVYRIYIPTIHRNAAPEALASVLAHEATHAYDVITGALPLRGRCSVEAEVRAFMNGLAAWVLLKGDNALSGTYTPRSFESTVNNSLRSFNSGSDSLRFDFDVQGARNHVRRVYGASCGAWDVTVK